MTIDIYTYLRNWFLQRPDTCSWYILPDRLEPPPLISDDSLLLTSKYMPREPSAVQRDREQPNLENRTGPDVKPCGSGFGSQATCICRSLRAVVCREQGVDLGGNLGKGFWLHIRPKQQNFRIEGPRTSTVKHYLCLICDPSKLSTLARHEYAGTYEVVSRKNVTHSLLQNHCRPCTLR